jgi:glutamyl-tRNA(Gln) amidotransferase subunit E
MNIDYEKIGLKCGIEIHQQLDTEHKLFCSCKARLSPSKPDTEVVRKLRAVAGELGEVDLAALHEIMRNKEFHYQAYPEETCLVECDDEPPHELNREALGVALTIGLLMKCEIPEEIHVMRKTVIDGSNTSGFQRTAIIGLNGKIQTSFGDVGITNLCLEEEACQILGKEGNKVIYGLDRLGIPLVEIGTSPDIRTPEQAREVAEKLGMIVRSTGKAKRGIGTIRQDINISIKGGERIEIKGAQELRMIPKLVDYEVQRQMNLLKIKKDLKKIGFKPIKPRVVHVSHIFKEAKSKITRGKTTFAILIPNFAGFLKRKLTPSRTLGNEIANYVRAKSELKGIIHSDEDLESYQLTKEFDRLAKHLKARKGDTLIIAAGERGVVEKTMHIICERINLLAKGIPKETRKALETGDTEYMRPLPGSARLYPETDIMPIRITEKKLRDLQKSLPELIEEKEEKHKKEIIKKFRISEEITKQIIKSGRKPLFDKLAKFVDPSLVATTLTSTLRYLEKKEKVPIRNLEDSHFISIFQALKSGKLPKEAIPEILKEFAKNPKENLENILKKIGLKILSLKELEQIVQKTIRENQNLLRDPRGEKILLGLVMRKVRGRAEAKKVMDLVSKEFKKK